MLSFLRSPGPARTSTSTHNPVHYENGRSSVTFHPPTSPYTMTHVVAPRSAVLTPPLHFHLYQDEHFRLRRGTANFYLGLGHAPFRVLHLDPAASNTTSSSPEEKEASTTITVPRGRYHRFENASATEDLVIDIGLAPTRYEAEERFFRNAFGYLNDCALQGLKPSFIQLVVFLDAVDGPLGLPVPVFEGLGRALSWVFTAVASLVGRWVLGYRASYPEYYEEGKTK